MLMLMLILMITLLLILMLILTLMLMLIVMLMLTLIIKLMLMLMLMLHREISSVCCEKCTKQIHTLRVKMQTVLTWQQTVNITAVGVCCTWFRLTSFLPSYVTKPTVSIIRRIVRSTPVRCIWNRLNVHNQCVCTCSPVSTAFVWRVIVAGVPSSNPNSPTLFSVQLTVNSSRRRSSRVI